MVMVANVLKSPTAIQVSIQIVRAFARLRQMLATHEELARKLAALEKKVGKHAVLIATLIEKLMEPPPEPKRRPISFRTGDDDEQFLLPSMRICLRLARSCPAMSW